MFSKHRLEALSDGIFAITMTLLVLDLKFPDGVLPPHFGRLLTEEWTGVVITFTIAAVYWTAQHRIFELVPDLHERTIVPTFVFLGLVSVLPFSTGYFSHHIASRSGFIVYFTHVFLLGLALLVKLEMLVRLQHPADTLAVANVRLRVCTMCFVMGLSAVGAVLVQPKHVWIFTAASGIAARLFVRKAKATIARKHAARALHSHGGVPSPVPTHG